MKIFQKINTSGIDWVKVSKQYGGIEFSNNK